MNDVQFIAWLDAEIKRLQKVANLQIREGRYVAVSQTLAEIYSFENALHYQSAKLAKEQENRAA